jgi:hypothetical protein
MPVGMEAIRERLTRLEELIGPISEDEEQHSINNKLREAIESAERAKSLYISLAAERVKGWKLRRKQLQS